MRLQMASGNIPSMPYPVRNVILRWSSTNKTSSPLSFCFPIPHRVKKFRGEVVYVVVPNGL